MSIVEPAAKLRLLTPTLMVAVVSLANDITTYPVTG